MVEGMCLETGPAIEGDSGSPAYVSDLTNNRAIAVGVVFSSDPCFGHVDWIEEDHDVVLWTGG
jgi:hypothetical protein